MIIGPLRLVREDDYLTLVDNNNEPICCINKLLKYLDFPVAYDRLYWLQVTKRHLSNSVPFATNGFWLTTMDDNWGHATFTEMKRILEKLEQGKTYYGRVLYR